MGMEDHPMGRHEMQLEDYARRLDKLESTVIELLSFKSGTEEQIKTIFKVLDEIKDMLQAYTMEMKSMLGSLSTTLGVRLGSVEQRVQTISSESGEVAKTRWEALLRKVLEYAAIAGIVYLITGK